MSPRVAPGALAKALRGGDPPPLVAAVGPESYLRDQVLRDTAEVLLGDASSPDLLLLQGASTSTDVDQETLARFFDETRTGSLFGGRKVVALRHADALIARYRGEFMDWLKSPGRAAVAVLLVEEATPALQKAMEAVGIVVQCGGRGGRGESPTGFVVQRASARGKVLGRAEAETLVELLGADLMALENAVEVLSLHAGERERIQRDDIEALFESAREGSVWAFGDLLATGDVAGALVEANRSFSEGIPESSQSRRVTRSESTVAVRLVAAFATSVCRGLDVRAQLDAGVPRDQVRFTGRLPWAARQSALRVATRRRPAALSALAVYAEETDRGLKSGGPGGREAIARLVAAVSRVP